MQQQICLTNLIICATESLERCITLKSNIKFKKWFNNQTSHVDMLCLTLCKGMGGSLVYMRERKRHKSQRKRETDKTGRERQTGWERKPLCCLKLINNMYSFEKPTECSRVHTYWKKTSHYVCILKNNSAHIYQLLFVINIKRKINNSTASRKFPNKWTTQPL